MHVVSPTKWSRGTVAWLLLILVLGAALRIYQLGEESLWNDELSSWRRSDYENIGDVIAKSAYSDYHPPLYQMLLFYVKRYIGDSEVILRFPSVISGVLSIVMIFLLGVRLYSQREGLIAAGLMAVSWAPIYYSQEARSYATLMLFSIISTYTWLPLMRKLQQEEVPPFKEAFYYIIPAVVCCYLHYYGVFLIAVHGLCTVMALRKQIMLFQALFVYVIIGVAYLPWLPVMLEHSSKPPSAAFVTPSVHTFEYYVEFLFSKSTTIAICVMLLLIYLVCYALHTVMRDKEGGLKLSEVLSSSYFLALWFVMPFAIAYLKSTISSPVFTNRNMIICLPAAYLLVARAMTLLSARPWLSYLFGAGMAAGLLFSLLFEIDYYSKPQKEQFREAVEYIVDHDPLYSNSMVVGYAWEGSYFNYYFEREGSAKRVDVIAGDSQDIPSFVQAIYTQQPEYIWYVAAHNIPDNSFIDFFLKNFTVLDYRTFNRAQVWLIKNPFNSSSLQAAAQLRCQELERSATEELILLASATLDGPCLDKVPGTSRHDTTLDPTVPLVSHQVP